MSIVGDCDCVVDALDNVSARLVLAHACSNAGIPLIYGAIAGWYGQVSVVCPGDLSYAVLYGAKDDPTEHGVERKLGNLPFTAAATAAIQTSQCVHVLLGHEDALLRNCILAIDLMSASAETIELA